MSFWITYNLFQISFFWETAKGRFSQCVFLIFFPLANHDGQHFYSAPSPPTTTNIKKLPTDLYKEFFYVDYGFY